MVKYTTIKYSTNSNLKMANNKAKSKTDLMITKMFHQMSIDNKIEENCRPQMMKHKMSISEEYENNILMPIKMERKMSIEYDEKDEDFLIRYSKNINKIMEKKKPQGLVNKFKTKLKKDVKENENTSRNYFDIHTVSNGDCFFDAISKMLPKRYINAFHVRSAAVKYCSNEDLEWAKNSLNMLASAGALNITYEGAQIDFKSGEINKYMSLMKKSGTWADDFWIAAVSRMANVKLEIYSPDGKLYAIHGEDNPALDSILIYTGDHYYVRRFL
jgi:hypothetical protein